MNIIGCLDVPTHGVYRLNGRDVGKMNRDELAACEAVCRATEPGGHSPVRRRVDRPSRRCLCTALAGFSVGRQAGPSRARWCSNGSSQPQTLEDAEHALSRRLAMRADPTPCGTKGGNCPSSCPMANSRAGPISSSAASSRKSCVPRLPKCKGMRNMILQARTLSSMDARREGNQGHHR